MAASTPGQGRCDSVRGWSCHVPAAVAMRAAGQRRSRHGSAGAVGSTATSAASGSGLCRHHIIDCALLAAEGTLAASQGQHGGGSTTRRTAREPPSRQQRCGHLEGGGAHRPQRAPRPGGAPPANTGAAGSMATSALERRSVHGRLRSQGAYGLAAAAPHGAPLGRPPPGSNGAARRTVRSVPARG